MIRILDYKQIKNKEIFARMAPKTDVEGIVADIISDVRQNGDEALYRYCEKFDHAKLTSLEVSAEEYEEAMAEVDEDFIRILKKAAENIHRFHSAQKRDGFVVEGENGVLLGQRIIPIEKAGLYVPGGTAAYPSTVLMDSIPAKIAGCREIVMVTPPSADGKVAAPILAAARIAGVDRVFKIGGAQAIAALAYGTES
ncbi:MAG: histidinol dehydrogenase, partial [Clostridia bacterium]|nr:histidinol dehydrogenase [Clostridia bacterium]